MLEHYVEKQIEIRASLATVWQVGSTVKWQTNNYAALVGGIVTVSELPQRFAESSYVS